ncbi:hypothetical protein PR003_g28360, partial [Phytophthora rubi]
SPTGLRPLALVQSAAAATVRIGPHVLVATLQHAIFVSGASQPLMAFFRSSQLTGRGVTDPQPDPNLALVT